MVSKLKALEIEAAKAGLKINTAKSKSMRCNTINTNRFKIRNVDLGDVTSFCYLGSIITSNDGSSNDVAYRISRANQAFGMLSPIWKSAVISFNTKIKLINSCVKSALLYASETWNALPRDINAVQVFANRCLRRILRIFRPATIANGNLWSLTNQRPIHTEILNRKWRWIGHTLLRFTGDIAKNAIDWTPQGNT
ncbi:uncharacterized protein LOC135950631 [Calliphora vicina]|uniref:uncharacterized protein LOC135950631 n=1 Tax=Calliphora vicina TaxID=7373 RepID=UPI00325A83A3